MKRTRKLITGALMLAFAGLLFGIDFPNRRTPYPVTDQADPQPAQKPRPDIVLLPRPADAVSLALADLQSIPVQDRCYVRWLWIPGAEKDAARVASLTLNYISRGSVIQRPLAVSNGLLLRVDLRNYAPRDTDLREWTSIWESFGYDPAFSLLITKDSVEFAEKLAELTPVEVVAPAYKQTIIVEHKGGPYDAPDASGRHWPDLAPGRYTLELEFAAKTKGGQKPANPIDVFRSNAPHLPAAVMIELQAQTHTCAPVTSVEYFVTRALSTIRDKGVFAQVFSGLYYDFKAIKKAKDVLGKDTKATDLDLYFESLGIGNVKAGLTQEKLFDQLRSDQRMAMFRSEITGKPRSISSFHTPADREGSAWGAITADIRDQDIDIGDRSFANLLDPRKRARESIFPRANGFPEFGIWNGDGERVDEVPPDVARDSTIPSPYTARLQPAIGCLRCHANEDGWKSITNDIKALTKGRIDIFGDLSQGRLTFDPSTIDRLAGLYTGDFSKNLRRARDDNAEVLLRASGSWNPAETQADAGKVGANKVAAMYGDYNYALIDARTALKELGMDVNRGKSIEVFKRAMDLPTPDANGVYLEKPTIAAIASGIPVLRTDWSLVLAEALGRSQKIVDEIKKNGASGALVRPASP